jgi:hypothetical protein
MLTIQSQVHHKYLVQRKRSCCLYVCSTFCVHVILKSLTYYYLCLFQPHRTSALSGGSFDAYDHSTQALNVKHTTKPYSTVQKTDHRTTSALHHFCRLMSTVSLTSVHIPSSMNSVMFSVLSHTTYSSRKPKTYDIPVSAICIREQAERIAARPP